MISFFLISKITIESATHYVHLAKKAPEKSPTKDSDLGKKEGFHVNPRGGCRNELCPPISHTTGRTKKKKSGVESGVDELLMNLFSSMDTEAALRKLKLIGQALAENNWSGNEEGDVDHSSSMPRRRTNSQQPTGKGKGTTTSGESRKLSSALDEFENGPIITT